VLPHQENDADAVLFGTLLYMLVLSNSFGAFTQGITLAIQVVVLLLASNTELCSIVCSSLIL
jgi:multisubunit Na+/H+ antiporter MnhB subunit